MGWQSRLSKDQKTEFPRTCNKCNGTGIRKTFVSMHGQRLLHPVSIACKCVAVEEKPITTEAPVVEQPVEEAV